MGMNETTARISLFFRTAALSAVGTALCISLGLLFSCSGSEEGRRAFQDHISEAYKRDSAAIAYAATEQVQNSYRQFPDFDDSTRRKIRALVDTVLYSPDSLKLFSIVFERIPETDTTARLSRYFNGSLVIGYRPRRDTCWVLYSETRPLSPINFGERKRLSEVMRASYFGENFKDVKGRVFEEGEIVSAPFGYSPTDSLFWTRGLYWRKGAHVDGLYYFQTVRDPRPGNMTHALRKRPIDSVYPDSIREMYKSCGE
jgi:hypothetical protein